MSRAIAILSWRGETVISSSRVCNIFYNIVTVLSSTQALDLLTNPDHFACERILQILRNLETRFQFS